MLKPMYAPLEHWRRHTHLLREGLLKRVDELSVSDYPGATPNEIIQFLQEFLKSLAGVVDKAGSEGQLRVLSSQIRELGVFLEWLDNAHTEQTPRGLVQLLKDVIDRMVPNSRVVARPQAQYNYSILDLGYWLTNLVKNYIPNSKQSSFNKYLELPLKLISFPRIERDNMLAHAIFGHELGHPIAAKYLEQEVNDIAHQATYLEIERRVEELVNQEVANSVGDSAKLAIKTRVFNNILQIRKRALEELISDAVGVFLFGPSAFFACYELFWVGNWDAKPVHEEWYPPSRMRLRLMLGLIEESGFLEGLTDIAKDQSVSSYADAMRAFIGEARQLVAITTDQDAINSDQQLKIAYDWMQQSLTGAVAYAKEQTKEVAFHSDSIVPQLSELIQRLEIGVPPNEVGDPSNPIVVDYRASLLAAWMFKLRGINPKSGQALQSVDIDRLHQKTLSAIEYVILQSAYAHNTSASIIGDGK